MIQIQPIRQTVQAEASLSPFTTAASAQPLGDTLATAGSEQSTISKIWNGLVSWVKWIFCCCRSEPAPKAAAPISWETFASELRNTVSQAQAGDVRIFFKVSIYARSQVYARIFHCAVHEIEQHLASIKRDFELAKNVKETKVTFGFAAPGKPMRGHIFHQMAGEKTVVKKDRATQTTLSRAQLRDEKYLNFIATHLSAMF